MKSGTKSVGRPKQCKAKAQKRTTITLSPRNLKIDKENDLWKTEDTAFGCIKRGPNGEVMLPSGVFDELMVNIETLSKRVLIVNIFS